MKLSTIFEMIETDSKKVTSADYAEGMRLAKGKQDMFDQHIRNVAKKYKISKEAALKGLDRHDKHGSFQDNYYAPAGTPT